MSGRWGEFVCVLTRARVEKIKKESKSVLGRAPSLLGGREAFRKSKCTQGKRGDSSSLSQDGS
jgi:hypothetical protein